MILRKALLISAPGGSSLSPGGLNSDLETTRNFLLSPRGGAWASHEITVLENPEATEITEAVKDMQADYTITYFSGRSFGDQAGNRFLILQDGDYIQDTELLNNSEKQLVLVDACPEAFSKEVIHFTGRPNEFQLARAMYDKWIERCEPGQMIMHANEKNSPAETGGIFTQKLLQVGSRVPAVDNRFNLKSILAAGHEVPGLMQDAGIAQGPGITYSQGNTRLPFAMAMPRLSGGKGNNNQAASGLALGLFLLGLFLSSE